MPAETLNDVYREGLQDAFSACKQSLDVTIEMGRAAEDKALSEALIDASNGLADGMDRLASLCAEHDLDPDGHHCKGMEGLAAEARAHALDNKTPSGAVRDATIITQYQRLTHYAIAAYGTLRTFANRLGLDGDAAVLTQMLDSGYDGDRRMTDVATGDDGMNRAAV
jgi:ferritin-like metal-binding protein YciE